MTRRHITNWQLVLASFAVSVALLIIAGEVYVRTQYSYVNADVLRHSSLEYEPTLLARHILPQARQTYTSENGARVSINSLGYRGPEFSLAKSEHIIRMVVMGGSAAFDIGASNGEDWPHLMEKAIHEQGYQSVELINAAVPGHASWDSLGRLYGEIWMLDPDFVIVYHCWNDIKYFDQTSQQRSLLRNIKPPPTITVDGQSRVANPYFYYYGRADRLLSYSQLYARVRNRLITWRQGGVVGLEGLLTGRGQWNPPSAYEGRGWSEWGPRQLGLTLRLIADAVKNIGAQPVLLTQARLPTAKSSAQDKQRVLYDYVRLSHDGLVKAFEACDEVTLAAGAAEDVPVLDLATPLSGRTELFGDHVHTTAAGSQAIASLTAKFLAEVLASSDDGVP